MLKLRYVFKSGDIEINKRNTFILYYCYLQTKLVQTIPNSQYRSNSQNDPKCQTESSSHEIKCPTYRNDFTEYIEGFQIIY